MARPHVLVLVLFRPFPPPPPHHFPVAPDTINNHVKTCREEKKSLHFFAPEYGGKVVSATGVLTLFVDLLGSV